MTTATSIRRNRWNTYACSGYTHCVPGGTQASAGGVHLHQVRLGRAGWQKRVCQSNGRHESYGPVACICDADGEAKFTAAQQY